MEAGAPETREHVAGDAGDDGPGGNPFDRVVGMLCVGGAAVAAIAVLITVGVTGYGIFMRYVLGTPINWTDELSGYLVIAIVMFGAAEALRRGDHVQVDLLTSRLSGRALGAMRVLWMAIVIVFMTVLLVSAWRAVGFSYDFGLYSVGYLETPMWLPQSLLVAGSVLVLLAAIAGIGRALRGGASDGDERR